MVINRVIFCVAALLSMLNISTINAASAVGGSDDDVLLLTQISQTLSCVSPFAQQKDGLSQGPAAEWVSTDFYLNTGNASSKIGGGIVWNIRNGGKVVDPEQEADIDFEYLKVVPTLGALTRKALGLVENEVLFFKLKVNPDLVISAGAVMVRMLEDTVTCEKRIGFASMIIPNFDRPKWVLQITQA